MDDKEYEKKAAKYNKQAKDATSTDVPVKLTPQEEQAVKDAKYSRAAAKAPTTRTTMGQRFSSGGRVSSRADGCAKRGKTKGRMI